MKCKLVTYPERRARRIDIVTRVLEGEILRILSEDYSLSIVRVRTIFWGEMRKLRRWELKNNLSNVPFNRLDNLGDFREYKTNILRSYNSMYEDKQVK